MDFNCVGIDIFVTGRDISKLPKDLHGLKLEAVGNRGTKLNLENPEPIMLVDWFRCRYLSATTLQDDQLNKFIVDFSKQMKWEKIQKLFAKDGENCFSKL